MAAQVDWYDLLAPEILVSSDAIQVKQHKTRRYRTGHRPAAETQQERIRVNTDIWLVECVGSDFWCLTAGIDFVPRKVAA